jgi:8-oxo-dGTP diphosphatase
MKRINVVYSLITNIDHSKILLVKNRDNGRWSLPGGAVEHGEFLEVAAIREAKEETGLDIEVFGIVAVNECKFTSIDEHAIFFTFNAKIVGGREVITIPDEIEDMQWIDIDQADKLMPYYNGGMSHIIRNRIEVTYNNQGISNL